MGDHAKRPSPQFIRESGQAGGELEPIPTALAGLNDEG